MGALFTGLGIILLISSVWSDESAKGPKVTHKVSFHFKHFIWL